MVDHAFHYNFTIPTCMRRAMQCSSYAPKPLQEQHSTSLHLSPAKHIINYILPEHSTGYSSGPSPNNLNVQTLVDKKATGKSSSLCRCCEVLQYLVYVSF